MPEPGVNPLVSYMRRLPRQNPPGTTFNYNTGETDLVETYHDRIREFAVERLTRERSLELLARNLAKLSGWAETASRTSRSISGVISVERREHFDEDDLTASTAGLLFPPCAACLYSVGMDVLGLLDTLIIDFRRKELQVKLPRT